MVNSGQEVSVGGSSHGEARLRPGTRPKMSKEAQLRRAEEAWVMTAV